MRSVGGCASALRRCSAGPRRSPVSARPVIAVWPVSAGYSRRLSLPTISSGCANWWGPQRSHARNPPTHRKSQQNRRKDLLDKQRSATQARVTFDDPTFRFANTEFFSVLLMPIGRAVSISRRAKSIVTLNISTRSFFIALYNTNNESSIKIVPLIMERLNKGLAHGEME